MGIALSAALVAGIAPVTAIAAETSSPTGAVALQTEDVATAKEKAYAAMQEALKNLEAAKDAAPSSTKQANSSNGKQATTTAGKLANTGDTTPSAIALAAIAAAGLGITAAGVRRLKNSK